MPKGQYDRSKIANGTKTGTITAPTGAKRGPKPGRKAKEKAVVEEGQTKGEAVKTNPRADNFFLMSEVRNNLATLHLLADKFGTDLIKKEVEAHVKVLGELRNKQFETAVEVVEDEPVIETEAAPVVTQSNSFPSAPLPTGPLPTIVQ